MTPLSALKSAALAATPGPYSVVPIGRDKAMVWAQSGMFIPHDIDGSLRKSDALYIAAADPQTVLQLVRIAEAAAKAYVEREAWLHDECTNDGPDAFAMHDAEAALDDALYAAGLI